MTIDQHQEYRLRMISRLKIACISATRLKPVRMTHNLPRIVSTTELPTTEARWITLKKIKYLDESGKERLWEYAERKTRSRQTGVDGVAILAVIRSKTNAFPVSTVIIEQYRPPIGKVVIELPAGLVDQGESIEAAALRELHEETGFKADKIIQLSPIIVSDPGMTNANMQLAVVDVVLDDKMETPVAELDAGEHIITRVVELSNLQSVLDEYDTKVVLPAVSNHPMLTTFQGFVVDARLSHFASGFTLAQQLL